MTEKISQNQNAGYLNEYLQTTSKLVKNNLEMTKAQLETLNEMNLVSVAHYQKNLDKVTKIQEEIQNTNTLYDKIKVYFSKIDQIGDKIEGMESSVEYLWIILDRIETKLAELEQNK